jgi:hypothetical protein
VLTRDTKLSSAPIRILKENFMPQLQLPVTMKMPLSGDVTQSINPFSVFFNPADSQIGLFNINLGLSSDPNAEEEIITDVASYGKQLGRMQDVMVVLLKRLKKDDLSKEDETAILEFNSMMTEIGKVKSRSAAKPRARRALSVTHD